MELTKEILDAMRAHNACKPDACYNENWNVANKTGTLRGRALCRAAVREKYGMCAGPESRRKVNKAMITDHIIYAGKQHTWAFSESERNGTQ